MNIAIVPEVLGHYEHELHSLEELDLPFSVGIMISIRHSILSGIYKYYLLLLLFIAISCIRIII